MNGYIKKLLDKNNITQKQLAQILGISAPAVAQWKYIKDISPDTLYSLSKLFHISVDDILNERLANETTEEKCERLYNIDGLDYDELIDDKKIISSIKLYLRLGSISEDEYVKMIKEKRDLAKQKLIDLSEKLNKMSNTIYELLYKKIQDSISEDELKELDYIMKYYNINYQYEPISEEIKDVSFNGKDRILVVGEILKNKIDIKNKDAFIWELQKIFVCNKKISWDKLSERINENDEVFCNIFGAYTQLEKDIIITQSVTFMKDLQLLTSLGANILYSTEFFPNVEFDNDDLKGIEGSIVNLTELDEKREMLDKIYDYHYELLTYDEYKSMINTHEMTKVKNYKLKEKSPIEYWEYFKKEIY